MNLETLNSLSTTAAAEEFEKCCGASAWVAQMVAARPFPDRVRLDARAERAFEELDRGAWLEAFTHHPKIGDIDSLRKKFAATKEWASGEQSGTATASDEVLEELKRANEEYEQHFGYIFIVCATGKSAQEMLDILKSRIDNDPDKELKIAAGEQKKITAIRINKLLDEETS